MTQSHPDGDDLYPEATGLALKTVKAHTDKQDLVLYAGWFCPFVQRIWIALEEKQLPYQYVEINPYHKSADLLARNPRGLVPTLAVAGRPLYESTVLCEFLEDAYPHAEPALLPRGGDAVSAAYDRARARIWLDYVTSRVVPAYFRFLQAQGDEGGLAEKRGEFVGCLEEFTREMMEHGTDGPYFLGRQFSLVDVAIAPFALRLWLFDYYKGGSGVPDEGRGGEDEEVWTRWRAWSRAVGERKSVRETTSEKERYLPIYKKYAEDKAQSEMAKATRAGRGVP